MVFSFTRKQQEDLFDTDVNTESWFKNVEQKATYKLVTQHANEPRNEFNFLPFYALLNGFFSLH